MSNRLNVDLSNNDVDLSCNSWVCCKINTLTDNWKIRKGFVPKIRWIIQMVRCRNYIYMPNCCVDLTDNHDSLWDKRDFILNLAHCQNIYMKMARVRKPSSFKTRILFWYVDMLTMYKSNWNVLGFSPFPSD